ncbi:MAG: hypothetical protein K2G16_11765, partial [Lachnospiraceae bacterium]|nr:hypothetical protein [Lachnospiraceae bacterium]
HVTDASYPFLIQEKYRAGYFTHYAGEGTIKSAKLIYKGEEVDLCLCRTKAGFSEELIEDGKKKRILTLEPVDIAFSDLTVKLQTRIIFEEGSSRMGVERRILDMSNPKAEIELNEYMVACYGTTEYAEDMSSLILGCQKDGEQKEIAYAYKCREEELVDADEVYCVLPPIKTRVAMSADKTGVKGYIKEGYAFSPMFTLGYIATLSDKEVFITWLSLEREN